MFLERSTIISCYLLDESGDMHNIVYILDPISLLSFSLMSFYCGYLWQSILSKTTMPLQKYSEMYYFNCIVKEILIKAF